MLVSPAASAAWRCRSREGGPSSRWQQQQQPYQPLLRPPPLRPSCAATTRAAAGAALSALLAPACTDGVRQAAKYGLQGPQQLQQPAAAATPTRGAVGGVAGASCRRRRQPGRRAVVAAAAATPSPTQRGDGESGDDDAEQQQQQRDTAITLASLGASLAGGALLAAFVGPYDDALPQWAQGASAGLSWTYCLAWSLSFYPQLVENWRRRSCVGLSVDYIVYSIVGYAAYLAYTGALLLSPGVHAAYAAAHAGSPPDVSLADVLFAGHALLVSLATLAQCVAYGGAVADDGSGGAATAGVNGGSSRPPLLQAGVMPSRGCRAVTAAAVAVVAAYGAHVFSATCADGGGAAANGGCDAWLPMLYLLGGIKVSMTLIKYTPQVLLNHARRSTDGWQINNVLLDVSGGALSLAQQTLDAFARADPTVLTGNPAKLGIAAVSLGFDAVFILQHYVLYRADGGSSSTSGSSSSSGTSGSSSGDRGQAQQQQPRLRAARAPPVVGVTAVAAPQKALQQQRRRAATVAARAARGGSGSGNGAKLD